MAPLHGIKVLDLSLLLPGPLATQMGEAGAAAEIALEGHVAAAPTLTLAQVMACFKALVEGRGPSRKRPLLADLLRRTTPVEAKYVIKIMGGDLRIGLQEGQLEDALAVCLEARSLSEAGRRLFSASRTRRTTANDADRLRKYLARFGLAWQDLGS